MTDRVDESEGATYENAVPSPEFLIKSIAEQGYSLETSLGDLIDNSVSAGASKIEILVDTEKLPFTLFLADNGDGMDEAQLKKCMQFPSSSLENQRATDDLGRFGLGMKTASFAQTRRFTVISKARDCDYYSARTWDVDYLKRKQEWRIIKNSVDETNELITTYESLSSGFFSQFNGFIPNTIVVWQGLYKFEDYLEGKDKSDSLKNQLNEVTTEYLAIVFHRFMERTKNPLSIRLNNILVKPFNPFPTSESDLRLIESKQKNFKSDIISLEGYILPVRSIEESKESNNIWTTRSRGLMDMEGLYIYRSDRIILFGGWNGIIRKSPRLQLARLKVEVGNKVDNLLHLNVAKSQIIIPFDLKIGFLKYIAELKDEAEKEYYNRGIRAISSRKSDNIPQLFDRKASNKGMLLTVNIDFPLVKLVMGKMDKEEQHSFMILLKMINVTVNKIRQTHEDKSYVNEADETDGTNEEELKQTIQRLLSEGTDKKIIKEALLPALGYRIDTIPHQIIELLK